MTAVARADLPCSCFALRKAARRVTQLYDRHLAEAGLRVTQFSMLVTLGRRGPCSIQDLAERMGTDRTTLARNLRPLERDGLLSVEVDANDRRGRVVRLTPAGAERLAEAKHRWAAAQACFEQTYGKAEARALHRMLDLVSTADFGLPTGPDSVEQ